MAKRERLDKVISNMGYGSRKEVKGYIRDGLVMVNGEVITKNNSHVYPFDDEILFNGEDINYREFIYLMMNKPQDYVSSTDDPVSNTVIDLLEYQHLIFEPFPVGRLDKDTEGLLIISNDGKLAHRLLSPKREVDKVYYAEVFGYVDEEDIEAFKKGVTLDDGYKTLPAKLEILEQGNVSKIHLTIVEGKFHQVKRMFESIDMEVTYLKRIEMAGIKLDESLELGQYRELSEEEMELLEEI